MIFEGVQCHRIRCATRYKGAGQEGGQVIIPAFHRIQAAWRGYTVRQWYCKLRVRVPPNDPKLRRRYFEDKLTALTERVVQSCAAKDSDVDRVLAQADLAVARSRKAMK